MVAHHEHIKMLGNRIDGVWPGRVGRRGQDIGQRGDADDIRSVPPTCSFRMIRVDRPTGYSGNGIFDKTSFINGIGMNGDLHVVPVSDRQTAIDGGGCCSSLGAPKP